MSKKVTFYFAYNSPYSFLGNSRIERELAPLGVDLEFKPVYSPRAGGAPDLNAPKLRYMFQDALRFAEAYGIAVNPGPFADSKRACLGFFHAQEKGKRKAYHDGVYAARWTEAKDIGQEETLAAIAEKAGLDKRAFLAALTSPSTEAALEQSNKDAAADEVFGFPTFIYDGKKFWGNDRIEWLVREIKKG